VLIPRWGAIGAAYSTLAAYAIALLMSWGLGRRSVPLPVPWSRLGRIVIAVCVMVLALLPVRGWTTIPGLAAQVMLGAVVYMSLVLTLRIVRANPGVFS